uniref:Uncharacterized protein n=1 Tax=Glossina brevipalpis TaxID=37001 RepID=A0A1A9W429_9MUSC
MAINVASLPRRVAVVLYKLWKFDERAFWEETLTFVVSLDYVVDKTRELTNNQQAGSLVKVNSTNVILLGAF